MTKMILTLLILVALSLSVTLAASSCYSCSNCGTTWDITKASVVSTSSSSDYCRKTVTGSTVNKDYASSCTSANLLGNGVFCCQTDLCNSAHRQSLTIINLAFSISFLWTIYHYLY